MSICPFMSDANSKVSCDEDCMLYNEAKDMCMISAIYIEATNIESNTDNIDSNTGDCTYISSIDSKLSEIGRRL